MRSLRAVALCGLGALSGLASAQDRLDLRVLYAGDASTERTDVWLAFLNERTKGARFADRQRLSAVDLEDVDVVVFDGDIIAFVREHRPDHPPQFPDAALLEGVPTVLVGGVGSALGNRFHLKAASFFG